MPVALRTRTWSSTGASGLSSRLLLLSSHPFSPACLGAGAIPVTESGTDRPDLCKVGLLLGDLTLGQACRQPITEQRSGPFTRQYRCREAPLPCSQAKRKRWQNSHWPLGSTHCRLMRVVRHGLMCDGLKDRAPRQCEEGNGSDLPVSRNWPGTLRSATQLTPNVAADARDGAAAFLILVFGQQAENIARLTWNDWPPSSSGQSRSHCRTPWPSHGANLPRT